MIIQILDHITEEIKQIRVDVFIKEQGFEDEFDEMSNSLLHRTTSIRGRL